MNVLQINSSDIIGSRFNGFDVRHLLAEQSIESHHSVWTKISDDPSSSRFFDWPGSRIMTKVLGRIERKASIHGRMQLQSFLTPLSRHFLNADVVHYHIVHGGFFSLDALPMLSRKKPSIWTWHDPWMMTGHCIYPLQCQRWMTGCGACPRLDLPFPLAKDRTAQHFSWKQKLLENMNIDIVVASDHMLDMARASPIGQLAPRLHKIPFGIDLAKFQGGNPSPARQRLKIAHDRLVIGIRAFAKSPYKGFSFFVDALRRLDDLDVPLTLLTTHGKGYLDEFIGRHQVIDLGWIDDEAVMLDALKATDLFIMPSTAEAFGMMAVEAMACGKPVIVFEGTSLPEVTDAPRVGLSVPMHDASALALAMRRLILDPDERSSRGKAGRLLAESRYSDRVFAERLAELYREVAAR